MEPRTQRRAGRTTLWLGAILVVFVVLASTAIAAIPRERSAPPAARGPDILTFRRHVKGLYPGFRGMVRIRVRNAGPGTIVLTHLRTTVGDAAPGCRGSNLRVGRFSGEHLVPAHGQTWVRVRIRMSRRAPDACQGARFPLYFSGRGVMR